MILVLNRYLSSKTCLMFLADGLLIGVSVAVSAVARLTNDWADVPDVLTDRDFLLRLLLIVGVYQICLAFNELYDLKLPRPRVEEMARIGQAVGLASLALAVLYFLFPLLLMGRGVFFLSAVLTSAALIGGRTILEQLCRVPEANLLILGTGETAWMVMSELSKRNDLGLRLTGFLHSDPTPPTDAERLRYPVLGHSADVIRVVEEQRISKIIVAMEDRRSRLPMSDLVKLRMAGISIDDAQSLMAALTGRVWLRLVQPSWFVFTGGFERSRVTTVLKRILDVILSVAGLVLAAPIMLLAMICIKLDSKGPCLYRQIRVGFKGKPFDILKFRSMLTDAEAGGIAQWACQDDPRVTRVGKYLRKFRLDELPQFINIIRGDMSFVGPRPERPVFVEELRKQILYYDQRHTVQPGLTGWAQVRFHYGASLEDAYRKLEYDLFYLKNMSIVYDCLILIETVRIVLLGWERSTGKRPALPAHLALQPDTGEAIRLGN